MALISNEVFFLLVLSFVVLQYMYIFTYLNIQLTIFLRYFQNLNSHNIHESFNNAGQTIKPEELN
jgi:hypothetical protein